MESMDLVVLLLLVQTALIAFIFLQLGLPSYIRGGIKTYEKKCGVPFSLL